MRPNERRAAIFDALCIRRHDTVENLASEFGVSEKTIRPFCRRPIPLTSLIKNGCRTRGLSRSIMWKTAMSPSFPVTFICRCRRK